MIGHPPAMLLRNLTSMAGNAALVPFDAKNGFGDGTSCAVQTQAHEKDLPRVFVFVAVGIGIGIAFGRHFDIDADSDPDTDSDPGISR